MTLSEIETILGELRARHPGLDQEMLSTLLFAAGWEERVIKDALALFKQTTSNTTVTKVVTDVSLPVRANNQQPENKTVQKKDEDITFYHPDGAVEQPVVIIQQDAVVRPQQVNQQPSFLSAFFSAIFGGFKSSQPLPPQRQDVPREVVVTVPQTRHPSVSPKNERPASYAQASVQQVPVAPPVVIVETPIVEVKVPEPSPAVVYEQALPPSSQSVTFVEPEIVESKVQESLVVSPPPVSQKSAEKKEQEIPEDLPLLPFESSPHVWSFSRYKDVFHKDASNPADSSSASTIQESEVSPQSIPLTSQQVSQEVATPVIKKEGGNEEIVVEKTPLTKGDESLVFLAGVMLLVIILILGYMYSNGRL